MSDLVKHSSESEEDIEKIKMEFELQLTLLEHQVIHNEATCIFYCKKSRSLYFDWEGCQGSDREG